MATVSGSLDANLLLRWLIDDIPAQSKLVDVMLARRSAHRVSDLAISETVYVMEKGLDFARDEIGFQIRLVIGHTGIVCNKLLIGRTLDRYIIHPKLSFVDCYLAEEAGLAHGLPLYTFDKKLVTQSDGLAVLV